MSVWKYMFDNEVWQRADIENLRQRTKAVEQRRRRDIKKSKDRVEELEQEVGELALICRTLMTVLMQQEVLDPDAFDRVLQQIDAEDGVIDGMVTPEAQRPKTVRPPRKRKR